MPSGVSASGNPGNIQQSLPARIPGKPHQNPREFDPQGKIFAVTGGGRGLDLGMAEALVEAGVQVHYLDRLAEPDDEFLNAQKIADPQFGGSLHYGHIDVRNSENLDEVLKVIAALNERLNDLLAAAKINRIAKAVDHSTDDIEEVMNINYTEFLWLVPPRRSRWFTGNAVVPYFSSLA